VALLALLFAASTLLHSGEGHAAFGEGDHFTAASLGDLPCDSDSGDHASDQDCVAVSCLFCVPLPSVAVPQRPNATPIAVAVSGLLADRSLLPQFRPPKLSAQT
jgi:hypothetical protein